MLSPKVLDQFTQWKRDVEALLRPMIRHISNGGGTVAFALQTVNGEVRAIDTSAMIDPSADEPWPINTLSIVIGKVREVAVSGNRSSGLLQKANYPDLPWLTSYRGALASEWMEDELGNEYRFIAGFSGWREAFDVLIAAMMLAVLEFGQLKVHHVGRLYPTESEYINSLDELDQVGPWVTADQTDHLRAFALASDGVMEEHQFWLEASTWIIDNPRKKPIGRHVDIVGEGIHPHVLINWILETAKLAQKFQFDPWYEMDSTGPGPVAGVGAVAVKTETIEQYSIHARYHENTDWRPAGL
ncbi:hypothetical protein COX05_01740 [candidate division WWE3 bacterium CG22_combo_CG10-13_8_21_14_all_39_12]|uniref:Uncharacterized protein n=1 Tax=candidate division WWE3 bacterium CG22_combo_CG10-13_8_21_14_all_39_12 TaxID=1975094 RepID=A0A2H0BI54_UNCKA|nr:MAG: hypothetical protein COX05_01740 [candidate division WWE3 bacterium CG22_combo_CG10-13_8_21_14_all_39_12]